MIQVRYSNENKLSGLYDMPRLLLTTLALTNLGWERLGEAPRKVGGDGFCDRCEGIEKPLEARCSSLLCRIGRINELNNCSGYTELREKLLQSADEGCKTESIEICSERWQGARK